MKGEEAMIEGPITQVSAVMFLRARHVTVDGRHHKGEECDVARQRAYCQSKAEQLGVTILKEYVEYGGTEPISRRPVMRGMLGDLRTLPDVQYVLSFSLDRLARKPEDLPELEQQVQAAGANLLDASGLPVAAYYCYPDESRLGLTTTND